MKLHPLIAAAGLVLAAIAPASADFKAEARQVFADKAPSVIGVRGLLKIEASMNGKPAGSQDKQLHTNGVVIADDLIAVAYRTLKPDVSASLGKRPGLTVETELSELKLITPDGEEYDAKLVLHDEDLGVAFVAVDPKGENADGFSIEPLDVSKDVTVQQLDDLIAIGRLPEKLRSVARVNIATVAAIVERPRMIYICQGISMSNPVFNASGDFIGLSVAIKNTGAAPVIMPAKYIRKVMDQAKTKQAELAK